MFVVGGEEIVYLYDVPHPLKGIRNKLLQADVHFKWLQNKVQRASWNDIIALYKGDNGTYDFRMCNR